MAGERTIVSKTLIEALSAAEATGTVLGPAFASQARETTFYVIFGAGTTAGAVMIESAHDPAYTGTWAQQGSTVTWGAATRVHTVSITGTFLALRARISTVISGGTVTVIVVSR
jgi:hypothetical protein